MLYTIKYIDDTGVCVEAFNSKASGEQLKNEAFDYIVELYKPFDISESLVIQDVAPVDEKVIEEMCKGFKEYQAMMNGGC